MAEETVVLHGPGSLPGIPGEHGPGVYLVDYEARTIRLTPVISPIEVHIATVEVPPAPDIVLPPVINGG
jgi:hypothetical protein